MPQIIVAATLTLRHVQTDSARPAVGIALLYAYQLPQQICIREIVIAPTAQKE